MTDDDFNRCSDTALQLTRAIMEEFSLASFGVDEVQLFNRILKELVISMLNSPRATSK